jgi:hypothetical protein
MLNQRAGDFVSCFSLLPTLPPDTLTMKEAGHLL